MTRRTKFTDAPAQLEGRACIAPREDDTEKLCGAPARTTRLVNEIECALCAEHAREYDDDIAAERAASN